MGEMQEQRFMGNVEKLQNGCWRWTGGHSGCGDASFWTGQRIEAAHRYVYEAAHGRLSMDMVVVRTCAFAGCVNPQHLAAMTRSENLRHFNKGNVGRTHCIHGHEFSPGNTRIDKKGRRNCRQCDAERLARRRRAAIALLPDGAQALKGQK